MNGQKKGREELPRELSKAKPLLKLLERILEGREEGGRSEDGS